MLWTSPSSLTEAEAADWLSVQLKLGRNVVTPGGQASRRSADRRRSKLLFYRWRVGKHDGTALAVSAANPDSAGSAAIGLRAPLPTSSSVAVDLGAPRPAALVAETGAALLVPHGNASQKISRPRDARRHKASGFRIASLCRDALSRHLTGPLVKRQTPALPAEVAAAVDRLEGRDPALRTTPADEGAHA